MYVRGCQSKFYCSQRITRSRFEAELFLRFSQDKEVIAEGGYTLV